MRCLSVLLAVVFSCAAASTAAAADFLADRHAAKSVACASCHGSAAPSADVPIERCLKCYGGSYAALAAKTDQGDINYHDTHIGEANCSECHHGHKPSELVCDQCHEFKVTVP